MVAFLRQGWRAARQRRETPGSVASHYWAVQLIVPDFNHGCLLARALAGRVLPIAQAPLLPLGGCARTYCRCRWRYLPNRRGGRDRRRFRVVRHRSGEQRQRGERRVGSERRKRTNGSASNGRQY